MLKKLNESGIEVDEGEVKQIADLAVPSRPHVWRALERHGNGASVWHRTGGSGSAGTKVPCAAEIRRISCENNNGRISRDDFFNRTKKGGNLFVKKDFELPLEDCIKIIHGAAPGCVFVPYGYLEKMKRRLQK